MKTITLTIINQFEVMTKIKEEILTHTKEECMTLGVIFFKELLEHVTIDLESTKFLDRLALYATMPITVIEARKMAFILHDKARAADTLLDEFVYRMLGHLMATIHVITHNYVFLTYGLKAYHQLGVPIDILEEIANNYYTLLLKTKYSGT